MGTFFDVKTPADQKLLQDYDTAVSRFRDEVSKAMDAAAVKEPSLAIPMHAAAEAMRARPLPSEVNASEDALKRMALSSLTIEMAFAKCQTHADSQEALQAVGDVVAVMRKVGSTTTSSPQFAPLTQAVIRAVADKKTEVVKEMDALVFDAHVAELKKLAVKPATPAKDKFQP